MSQDAVQEFKVFRNQFDAQYGAALNAVVNVVSKSGGNSLQRHRLLLRPRQGPQRPQRQGGDQAAVPARRASAAPTAGRIVAQPDPLLRRLRVPRPSTRRRSSRCRRTTRSRRQQNGNYPFRHAPSTWSTPSVDHRFNDAPVDVRPLRLRQPVHAERRARERRSARSVDNSKSHSIVGEHNWVLSHEHGQHACASTTSTTTCSRVPTNYDLQITRPSYTLRAERRRAAVLPAQDRQLLRDLLLQHRPSTTSSSAASSPARPATSKPHFTEHGAFTFRPTRRSTPNDSRPPGRFTFVQQTPGGSTTTRRIRSPPSCRTTGASPTACASTSACATTSTPTCATNDFYEDLLANPLYAGLENFVSDRSRQRHQQPAAAPRRHLRHAAATARWSRGRPPGCT